MFETNAQHHYCCSQFQTSRQSGSNYTLPDSLLLTSSRLMGSGMSDTVIVSSLITSTTWLIELIFILRQRRPRLVRSLGSPVLDVLEPSLQARVHEGALFALREPLRRRRVGHSVQGLRYGEDREEKVPITSEKRVNTV